MANRHSDSYHPRDLAIRRAARLSVTSNAQQPLRRNLNLSQKNHLDRSFKCGKCGGRLDLPDALTNETVLSCKNCGAPLGTWVEVKHDMKAAAREIA